MDKNEILAKVQEIFQDILDNEEIKLETETTAEDVEEWDSLTHVQLVHAIEQEFNIRFKSKEIMSWNKIGDMIDCIANK